MVFVLFLFLQFFWRLGVIPNKKVLKDKKAYESCTEGVQEVEFQGAVLPWAGPHTLGVNNQSARGTRQEPEPGRWLVRLLLPLVFPGAKPNSDCAE